MPELLFEIGTEELPSWYVRRGSEALASGLCERLERSRIAYGEVHVYATPRRLAVLVSDLAAASERRTEARRGPAAAAAFDASGAPTRAAQGFARGQGIDPSALTVEETERGSYVFAHIEVGGVESAEVLPPLLAELVATLPAPRKMRWGEGETPFVRPVAWLLALLDSEVLPVEAAGQSAGRTTYGHRFLAPEPIEVDSPASYLSSLREAQVLADRAERRTVTLEAARAAAAEAGLELAEDPALIDEVTDLVELPIGVLGRFDSAYLSLPDEVLMKVMIQHQRYFPTRERAGGPLAASFVSVSNNRVPDVDLIRRGYQQVLDGRLYDARFFWDADLGKSLSQHAWGLSGIGFHKKLGSMADKVARVADVSPAAAESAGLAADETQALEGALPIFRADLATEMVVEFPELEGVMARAYALEEGLPERVAAALEDGVLPRGPGAPLPSGEAGALLAVMDRLDKLVGFFSLGQRPSGSADPFALRRDANAVARVLTARGWSVRPAELIAHTIDAYRSAKIDIGEGAAADVEAFLWDRVASLLAEEGVATSVVRAAVADGPAVITAARRAHLLSALLEHPEFPDLMTLSKRAANLAATAPAGLDPAPNRFEDPHEAPLHAALPAARRSVDDLVAAMRRSFGAWDLGAGPAGPLGGIDDPLEALLALKAPLDAFLDNVLVMVEDSALRDNRLALLAAVRDVLAPLGALEELEGM
jgi:glycyl-tRNA synthetase beta chain